MALFNTEIEDEIDDRLAGFQFDIARWHDFKECGASARLLNRQRAKILEKKERLDDLFRAAGIDEFSRPSAYYTPVPPEAAE